MSTQHSRLIDYWIGIDTFISPLKELYTTFRAYLCIRVWGGIVCTRITANGANSASNRADRANIFQLRVSTLLQRWHCCNRRKSAVRSGSFNSTHQFIDWLFLFYDLAYNAGSFCTNTTTILFFDSLLSGIQTSFQTFFFGLTKGQTSQVSNMFKNKQHKKLVWIN